MHILHVTPYYAPAYAFGGVVRSVEGMARALGQRGHDVTVLTTDALDQTSRYRGDRVETLDGVQVIRAPNLIRRGRLNVSTPFSMRRLAADLLLEVDLVHCHEFRTVENLLVTPLVKRFGQPLVLSPHGTLTYVTGRGSVKAAWDNVLSPMVARRVHRVIGLTQAEINEVRPLWRRMLAVSTSFVVIPNGIDLADFATLPDESVFRERHHLGNAIVCLFLGRLHPRKGVHLLAEAFREAQIPNTKLVIAGPDEGAQSLVAPHLSDDIVLTGYLDAAERLEALAAADLFALPAVGEGLSVALLEAMGAGLPLLISPGCNLPEAVTANAALETEPTVPALTEALRMLLTDAPKRKAMGAAARRLVEERFTWEKIAHQLEEVYLSFGQHR